VVGGRLDREVERDLEAVLARGLRQAPDVVVSPELGMDGVVAAVGAADRPRRPGVAGRRHERVVRALAVRLADRVTRGAADDVETQLREPRQMLDNALEA